MIIENLLSIIADSVMFIFGILPSLPPMSPDIVAAGDWAVNAIGGSIGFLNILYGHVILAAIFGLLILLIAFDQIYWLVMWILKKIPVLNIK